jgi:hypothetical protein
MTNEELQFGEKAEPYTKTESSERVHVDLFPFSTNSIA